MDSRTEYRARLTLPSPYLLFCPPANAKVSAAIHNPAEQVPTPRTPWPTGLWALDYGLRPTFSVQGVQQRQGNAIVLDAQGTPVPGPPAARESEYAYPYAWSPFVGPVQGSTVPRGKEEASAVMVPANVGVDPHDLRVLRFRWRGTVAAAVPVGDGDGSPGPFNLDFADHGGVGPPPPQPPPIVPGTVKISAPGGLVVQDWPWPRGDWQAECRYGRLIGDVDPTVDSWIDYTTGQAVVTFNANVPAAANNITADFEHEWVMVPLDIFVSWDADSI